MSRFPRRPKPLDRRNTPSPKPGKIYRGPLPPVIETMVETSGYWTWLSVVGEPRSRIVHHHRVEGFKRDRFLMPFGLLDPSLALSSNRRIFSLQRSRFRSIRVTKKLLFQFSFFSFFLFCDVFSNETWSCWIDEEEGRKKGNSYLYLDYLGRF